MARLQSEVSSGKKAKKGAAVQAVGDNPPPNKPPSLSGAEKFEAVDFAGHQPHEVGPTSPQRRTLPTKRSAQPPTGYADFSAQKESRGIQPGDPSRIHGNSPKRSAGRKTQASDERKLSTAGS